MCEILAIDSHGLQAQPMAASPCCSQVLRCLGISSFYSPQVRLYQVLDPYNMYSADGVRLIEARRISAHKHGWEVFRVKDTVQEWVNYTHTNHGRRAN